MIKTRTHKCYETNAITKIWVGIVKREGKETPPKLEMPSRGRASRGEAKLELCFEEILG